MKKTIVQLILTVLLLTSMSNFAFANYYGQAKNYSTGLDGCFFRSTLKATDAKWTSSNDRFILHTTWLNTDGNGSWIEVGFLDGEWIADGTYYKGYYAAQYQFDSQGNLTRNLKKISGPSTDIDTVHTFQIQRDGTNTWGVYVDYTLRQTWTSGSGSVASYPDVGLESNNTTSTSAQWNERNFQVYKNSTWSNWSSGSLNSSGNASVSWATEPTSIYSSQN